jgi:hypothetical protein
MVLGRAEETEAFFGDFQVAGPIIAGGGVVGLVFGVFCYCAHTCFLCVIKGDPELIPEKH